MKIISFGSLNVDHVYQVPHFVKPGETLSSTHYAVYAGGKGANQSVALARAGAKVSHAGKLGFDGVWLKEYLSNAGIDASLVFLGDVPTGHAIIQVAPDGANSIVLFGGANQAVTDAEVRMVLERADQGDLVLIQNELNATGTIIEKATDLNLTVAFNPAPYTPAVNLLPLHKVSYLILNEVESSGLSGFDAPSECLAALTKRFPNTHIILTLGDKGVLYGHGEVQRELPAYKVQAIDTTAAGDTFIGYFLAEITLGGSIERALDSANRAASICVTRKGASESIPHRKEVTSSPGLI